MSLRDDLSMYYRGTYVALAESPAGTTRVLYVQEARGDGRDLEDHSLWGNVYELNHESGICNCISEDHSVPIPELDFRAPRSGYYRFQKGEVYYFEYTVANRTNRKGFESSRAMINGSQMGFNWRQVLYLFAELSYPGRISRDFYLHPKGDLFYRGNAIGSVIKNELKLTQHKYLENILCKLLPRYYETIGQ